ncbi:9757_t:CDS:2, partial [Acaulospora colombiana]
MMSRTDENEEWLDAAIKKRHIRSYEYGSFEQIQLIATGGFDDTMGTYFLIFQYANGGTLQDYLRDLYRNGRFSELGWPRKIEMAKDIASGLYRIHAANIIHLDLHSKNVLIHNNKLMITDFGLSKFREKIREKIREETTSIVGNVSSDNENGWCREDKICKINEANIKTRIELVNSDITFETYVLDDIQDQRDKVKSYFAKGNYVKALELWELILKDSRHTPEDR